MRRILSITMSLILLANSSSPALALTANEITTSLNEINESIANQNESNGAKIIWTTDDIIQKGSEFNPLDGVKAYNKNGEDVTKSLEVKGNVNSKKVGSYKLKYLFVDVDGEEVKTSRTIVVSEIEKEEDNISPIILGSNKIITYKNETFDPKVDIQATDKNGKDITNKVKIKGEVDIKNPGSYKLEYSVEDEFGNKSTFDRTVNVIEKNIFKIYTEKLDENTEEKIRQLAFSFYLDTKTSKFIVDNQSDYKLNESNPKDTYVEIKIFDEENKEKLSINLLGEDTGDSKKLEVLKEYEYSYGDFISINLSNSKDGFAIKEKLLGDIDIKDEDYSDGVDNIDYIDNVRFKITETGIKSIYNQAPVFEGLTDLLDIKNPDIDVFEGVKVTDDHDGTIDNSNIVVEVKEKTETYAILTYTVEDSWGRTTSAIRNINSKAKADPTNISETKSIESNIITVEGTPYSGDLTERFKIKFDNTSKSIKVVDEDGRIFSNTEKGEYFKFELYDKNMEMKTSVTLLGSDKSDSKKLEAINNHLYELGDYIGIWHAESDSKLKIAGNVRLTNKQNGEAIPNGQVVSYENGLPKAQISERRFKITNRGLEQVDNDAPKFGELESLTVSRGQEVELLNGVLDKITDDFDKFDANNIENGYVSITHTPFDNTKVGEQIITYTATDRWGNSSTKDRTITVTSTNPLDTTYIEFMDQNKSNESLFKINIDPVKKQLIVDNLDNLSDRVIDSSKSSSIFKLKVYTQAGILQKTLNIKGTDKLKTVLRKINGYTYNENDRIELWSTTPENIKVVGQLIEDNEGDQGYKDYEPNESHTNGVNNADYKEDYANGINDEDYMKNVRFEIGKTNLKYIYNKAPQFHINTELTAKRNGKVEYMEGISVLDDYDDENELLKKVTYSEIDTSTIGEKYVEYKVVDSWGRSTLIKRKVTVYPENKLEYNYITIKNNETDELILSIRFDEDTKQFKVYKLDASKIPSSLSDDDKLLEIKLIKKNSNSIFKFFKSTDNIKTITITKSDLRNNNLDNKFNDIKYSYGDYLSFNSYNYAKGILISAESHVLLNGFDDEDQMLNSRFEIRQEGLQMTYNNEPEIFGLENTLYIYRGEELTLEKARKDITVKDDLDDIKVDSIKVKFGDNENLSSIDTDTIGNIKLTYELTDSWGRTASRERVVSIISKSVSNDIEFYDESGQNKLLSLKYNPISHQFDITRNKEISKISKKNIDTNVDSLQLSTEKVVVFRLNIFNTNGEEVGKLELSEDEILSEESLSKLSSISIYDDYYFSVWSNKPNRIKIQGDIAGENSLGESGSESEDYSEGITNEDHMDNVRFKLRTDGLEAVYNKAPKIIIRSRDIFSVYAGDKIDYTSGVIVKDDHDGSIPIENIKVDLGENKTEQDLKLGENIVNLSVQDSWGRETTIERKINIVNGIYKNTIRVTGTSRDVNVLQIGFTYDDTNKDKLEITTYDRNFQGGAAGHGYFKIGITREIDGEITTVVEPLIFGSYDKPTSENLKTLAEYELQYGDFIEIYHGHPNRLIIDEKVIDARENYTDGVQNPENLLNTKFQITKSGLKAVYTNPDENELINNVNIIGPMAPEKFPFKLKVNPIDPDTINTKTNEPTGGVFTLIRGTSNTQILSGTNSEVYRLIHIRSDVPVNSEGFKTESILRGNYWGHDWVSNAGAIWNNRKFKYGDYLYIQHLEPHRSIIKGNVKGAREDYSDGFDSKYSMNNVLFKLTKEGLEAVYNEAPKIHGVEDIDVYQGDTFNVTQNVTYSDDYDDGHLIINVTGDDVNNGELDTSELGEKIVTYTATDRWGNTTTVERKVTVRPNLYKNIFKVFSDTNTETPIFEIGFDSITNKYRVFNQRDERISSDKLSETAFEIQIIGQNRDLKKKITLTGNDRGNSPELNKLNEISYEQGDIIRVYRSNLNAIKLEGDVTGDIPNPDDMIEEMNKLNYMKNTGFEVSNAGLRAIYNHAPELIGNIEDKTVSKGAVINFLEGLNVRDDNDTDLSVKNIAIYVNDNLVDNAENYTFDSLGTYDVDYVLYDSWGRGALENITMTVESKVRENKIEVYDLNQDLAFKVTFDTTNNKFILTDEKNLINFADSAKEDIKNEVVDDSNEDGYFKIIVRDIKGNLKYSIVLNGNQSHDLEELKQIHNKEFSRYDTISLYSKNPNGVKIQGGVISSENNDYSTGFGQVENYEKVRFKITDDGLKEMTKKSLQVTGVENKTIKRGDDIDFLEGVLVDVQDTNNEDYKVKVDPGKFNKLKEGIYEIKYTITNSWGEEVIKTREITVEPRNELEKIKLNVKNNSGEVILTIGFDSIEKKLRVLHSKPNSTIDSNNSDLAFAINAYDSLGNTLGTIELKGTDTIDENIVFRLNNFQYVEGYALSIWAKDPQKNLELEGNIKVANKNTKKIIGRSTLTPEEAIDKMENGRYEILRDGLEYIYNNAPVIEGGDTPINYYKGSLLTIPSDISVKDDHDSISKNQVTIDDDQVDYDTLGEQEITYIVEDTWGRIGTKKGKINVISSLGNNEINIYSMNSQGTASENKAFDIRFKRANDKNIITIENQGNDVFYPSAPEGNDTFMIIKIHGADGKLKEEFKLLSTENATNSVGLNGLDNYNFDSGDYISIDGITDETKGCIKIIGTVVNEKEDYLNGVDELDNIQNVRFKFTDLGLESVYNEKPTIIIDENIEINAINGDDIPYMRGVRLKDDHDTLTSANVEVTWNPGYTSTEEDEPYNDVIKGVSKVGENILHYKVTDSWGRTSEAERTVNLSNGILENNMIFQGPYMTDMLKLRFEEMDENNIRLKLDVLNVEDIFAPGSNVTYYQIKITKPDDTVIESSIYSEDKYTGQFDDFNDLEIPYGTKIQVIKAGRPNRLIINGPVRNQREDYSDGVQNPENYFNVEFIVTTSGLKSIFTDPDSIEEKENIIGVSAPESFPIKFRVGHNTASDSSRQSSGGNITIFESTTTQLYYELTGNPNYVFRMELKDSNGQLKSSIQGGKNTKGNQMIFTHESNSSGTNTSAPYEYGDTLTIYHLAPKRIVIKGNVNGAREDYSDGVDNAYNLEEAVFKLTENGLEALYKEAPKITGVKDTKILKGEKLNLDELILELQATDSIDGDYSDKIIIGQTNQLNTAPIGTIVIDPTSINTDKVGMYEVLYSVTNSNNRTARKSSTIIVYDKPVIEKNENSRIELNSIENDEEAIVERLKEAVTVYDEDDELYDKTTKLEVLEHNLNPNKVDSYEVTYKATDLNGAFTIETIAIEVIRTINVSVPNYIPFQVVTNLTNDAADEFVSGVMKVKNNNTSDVDVYIESFTTQNSSTNENRSYENLEIVKPDYTPNWDELSSEDTMTKMALGIYNKKGLNVDNSLDLTKESPLWLDEGMQSVKLGVLNRAENLTNPYEVELSFTSRHGKNFIGGRSKGKFDLVFRFE